MESPRSDTPSGNADRELRARIIDVASQLIVAQGYTATTSDQIAKACKISKKTLYRIFPTKEQLLQDVITVYMRTVTQETEAVYARTDLLPRERIALVMEVSMRSNFMRSLPAVQQDIQRAAPHVWDALVLWRTSRYDRFSELLTESLQHQELRRKLSSDDVRSLFMTFMDQCVQFLASTDVEEELIDVFRAFLDVFFRGVLMQNDPTEVGA